MTDQRQQSRWRPTRKQLLWVAAIVGVVVLLLLIRLGYTQDWTGFGQTKVNVDVKPAKTLWDWLSLLIIPIVLAIGGYWFNRIENRRSQNIAQQRADADQRIAEQRRHDDALQKYLDHIGELLLHKDHPLRQPEAGEDVRTLARARTLSLLDSRRALPDDNWLGDDERKRSVLQFLYEAKLIDKEHPVVDLRDANMMSANLNKINLSAAHLSGIWFSSARLYKANLSKANLGDTDFSNADLGGADLSDAKITVEQLADVEFLEGATMPNRQKYEEWLKTSEGKKYQEIQKQYGDELRG